MKRNWWLGLMLHEPDKGAGGSAPAGEGDATGDAQGQAPKTGEKEKEGEAKGANGATFTQADVDRMVSQAIKTREQKLQEKHDQDKLAAEGKYRELYEKEQREKAALELRVQTRDALAEKGLGELAPFFEADASTLDGRLKAAEGLKARIDALVQQEVLKRLESRAPGKGDPNPAPGKLTAEQIEKMSQAEYEAAYKKGQIA
jgi:hypothetical protein